MMRDGTLRAGDCDQGELEVDVAEEEFLIMAQTELQRLLNVRGLRYRDLARRMGVTEARVSKLFGDDPANLTLRSVARMFHILGETAVVTTEAEVERRLADARGQAVALAGSWSAQGFAESLEQFGSDVEFVGRAPAAAAADAVAACRWSHRWMEAEEAATARRVAGGRR